MKDDSFKIQIEQLGLETAYEQMKPMQSAETELLTHRVNVALRALTLIHEAAKKRSRVNMQDGMSLEAFTALAIREVNAHQSASETVLKDAYNCV